MSEAAAAGLARLLSDDRLTRRAVGGDEQAFAAIFRRYHQQLYRFCLAIVGNPDDAQDALQNTMAKVLRALPGEERQIELKPWLYRIAHNESIDLLRRRRESRPLDAEQIAPGHGLAEDVATRERLRQLIADLRELPDRQREVLVMRELSGLDFGEIGSALGTSSAVARQTLYEARQNLRQMDAGREMSCATVTKALSDGDGRVIRRRDVRAHLRTCTACSAFRDEIKGRQRDLAAVATLPAVAAAGMLQGLTGGSSGAAGGGMAATLGGGAAKAAGASALAKGIATAAVVAAVGVTAADRAGVIHLGLPGDNAARSSGSASPAATGGAGSAAASEAAGGGASAGRRGAGGQAGPKAGGKGKGGGKGSGKGAATQHAGSRATPGSGGATVQHSGGGAAEVELPAAAAKGQEAAGSHRPPPREGGSSASSGHAAGESAPSAAGPQQPAKEPPSSAPSAPEQPSSPEAAPDAAGGAGGAAGKAP
jgi:RNA polymerase sigma factor (sigma-70 family)